MAEEVEGGVANLHSASPSTRCPLQSCKYGPTQKLYNVILSYGLLCFPRKL